MTKILDEPRSKPSIDPLEKPNKEDELDALLKLNTPKRTTATTSNQAKKSNPIVYNFTEPIENLHLGLSSSGKDFSRTTTAKKGPELAFNSCSLHKKSLLELFQTQITTLMG